MRIVKVGEKDPASEKNEQAVGGNGDGWCWACVRAVAGVESTIALCAPATWGELLAVGCVAFCYGIFTAISTRT